MITFGTLILIGRSGQRHEFEIHEWGTRFETFGAVYYVSRRTERRDGTATHTEIYFGETADMSGWLHGHHRAACFENQGANAISVHRDEDPDSRRGKLEDLIEIYDPPCNRD